ncbi:MAG TPA: CCA tRNA nucleotidyltransferase [Candidatus Polarisedimenticolaceae bacterium]|nr:CCA tRNA nucleotidyltransferase [Candidatus Polarisedimenticolaceae bacterium]
MVLRKIKALLSRGAKGPRPDATDPPPAAAAVDPPSPPPHVHRGPEVVHHPVALQDLDPDAVRIVKRLARFDHAAYLVGGCVRDLLLERKPKDFDIGTSATPRQIKRLFSNCRIIGRRFRLAHIYFQNGKIIEVATFRAKDVADNGAEIAAAETAADDDLLIRDDNVFGTPEEDALRRDFTINALFYDVNAETVIDHADGLGDLRRRLVRTIGDPMVRFREDPIRILRAIKFAARLDFAIEPKTLEALRRARAEIPKAAPPRVLEEFNRFCRSGAGERSFALAFDTGVFEVILPELASVYAQEGLERRMLAALLRALDARWTAGRDVGTGEIFAALLLPALAPALGLAPGATDAPPGERRDARDVVDETLRPIALRLRVARKDQEHARQIFTTLQRMVPLRSLRRGAKAALVRRPAFRDALGILEALVPIMGDTFAAAHAAWSESAPQGATTVHEPAPAAEPGAAAEPPTGKRRRGRRGGRRHRKDTSVPGVVAPGAPAPASADRPAIAAAPAASKLPPVWDDNYFFAALPSVPALDGTEDDGGIDRYGAGIVMAGAAAPPQAAEGAPLRRRRRGGRRRRKGGPIIPASGSSSPAEGGAS